MSTTNGASLVEEKKDSKFALTSDQNRKFNVSIKEEKKNLIIECEANDFLLSIYI